VIFLLFYFYLHIFVISIFIAITLLTMCHRLQSFVIVSRWTKMFKQDRLILHNTHDIGGCTCILLRKHVFTLPGNIRVKIEKMCSKLRRKRTNKKRNESEYTRHMNNILNKKENCFSVAVKTWKSLWSASRTLCPSSMNSQKQFYFRTSVMFAWCVCFNYVFNTNKRSTWRLETSLWTWSLLTQFMLIWWDNF